MAFNYKDWYEKNKVRLSEKRKKDYKEKPAVRKAARKRASNYYKSHKKVMDPVDRMVVKTADGYKFFSIGKVARAINRKLDTVRRYHAKGVIPEPKYYDSRGWRLYTREQALLLQKAFKNLDTEKFKSLGEVSEYLTERWEETNGEESD